MVFLLFIASEFKIHKNNIMNGKVQRIKRECNIKKGQRTCEVSIAVRAV